MSELYRDWHKEFQYVEDQADYEMSVTCPECGAEFIDGNGQHYMCCSLREE